MGTPILNALERHLKAMQDLVMVGEQVTWEIIGSEGWWYVTASHSGSDDPSDNFKVGVRRRTCDEAISDVAKLCWATGPSWLRNGSSPV
jgi:hypothetical protein